MSEHFSVEDIRPADLMREQARLFEEDVARLTRHAADFRRVPCPACGSDSFEPWSEKMGLSYVSCTTCRTIYTSPRPQPEHLSEYYRTSLNYEFWATHIFPASEATRRERIFEPRAQRLADMCERHGVGRGRLVEVGPGFGTFGQVLLTAGTFASVIAVEPTPNLAEACRSRRLEVIESPIEDVDLEQLGEVDVVVAFEVIEHLYDPSAFVVEILRILRPGGLLVLSCPNGLGFEVQTLRAASTTVDAEHVTYFNPESLPLLLRQSGFEIVEISTPGRLDADLVRVAAQEGLVSLAADPFLEKVLVEDWDQLGEPFQDFLVRFGLSSHMWAAARRPV